MAELTPEQQAQANEQAAQILSDPTNAEKYPELFAEAEKMGVLKEGKLVLAQQESPLLQAIKSRYGNYNSEDEFFAEVDKMKAGGSFDFGQFMQALPAPIAVAIEKASKGEDWTQAVKGEALIDFSKNYAEDELLNMFYPNKFKEEDLADPENVAVKAAKNAAKEAFLIKKQEKENERLRIKTLREQQEKAAKDTLEETIADFKKVYPKATDAQISRLRSELITGKFNNLFLDGRGGFNKDAASNLFPLMFPNDWKSQFVNTAREQSEKTAHEILDRGGEPSQFTRKPVQRDKFSQLQELTKMFSTDQRNPFKLEKAK